MFDSEKHCLNCGWFKRYDSNRDIFRTANKNKCPKCNKSLLLQKYNINL